MSRTIVLKPLDEKKRALLERASARLVDSIEEILTLQVDYVVACEKVREHAQKEGFTVRETKQLIGILGDKLELSPFYKKKMSSLVYPQITDKTKLARKWNDPLAALEHKEIHEADETIIRISHDQISKKDNLHVLRVYNEFYEIKLRDGKVVNMRADTEPNWVNKEDWEIEE